MWTDGEVRLEAGELWGREGPWAWGWLGSEATRLGECQMHPGHHPAVPEEGTQATCVCILLTEIICEAESLLVKALEY